MFNDDLVPVFRLMLEKLLLNFTWASSIKHPNHEVQILELLGY